MMGQSISEIRRQAEKATTVDEKAKEERVHVLERMINLKLENEMNSILNGEKNDQKIDTGTIVSFHKLVYIKLEDKESEDLKDAISELFSGDFIGGLESIVQLGAETVLGNDSMGEYETTDMFIVWNENALLRCDAYYYRWNFVSKSVIDETQGVTGVLLIKRVVDLTKTDPQVLTWAITNMADRLNKSKNKPEKPVDPNKLINDALQVLENVIAFQAKIKASEAGGTPEKPSE